MAAAGPRLAPGANRDGPVTGGTKGRSSPPRTAGHPGTGTLRLNPAAFARTTGACTAANSTAPDLEFVLEPLAGPCDHRH